MRSLVPKEDKQMVAKDLCIKKTRKIVRIAKNLHSAVFDKDLTEGEWENYYQTLGRIEGDLYEAFHGL